MTIGIASNRRAHRGGGSWRRLGAVAGVSALAAVTLAGCGGGQGSYTVRAVFANAAGLYAGNAVEILGVPGGTVTKVAAHGSAIVVTMQIDGDRILPANVDATLTNPEILGTPDVDLGPGYTGGAKLAPGGTIPESRTTVPVSVNRLLVDLQQALAKVDPQAVGGTVSALAQDLAGQGQALNQLIGQGAGTLQLLAKKGNDLGRLTGSLAAVTGTLRQQTSQLTTLLQDYDTVVGVLDANRQPLGQAIGELATMSQDLANVLAPNLAPLRTDIATITQLGRTVNRNLPTIDQILTSGDSLFSAAQRADDPTANWLNLNLQMAPGQTAAAEVGQVRDVLAGICRRLSANHASAFSASVLSTLHTCGNPNSGFFNPILGMVPELLSGQSVAAPAVTPSAQQLLEAGLARIPGLSTSQRQAIGNLTPEQLSGTAGSQGSGSQGAAGSSAGPTSGLSGGSAAGSTSPAGSSGTDDGLNPAPAQPVPSSGGGLLGGLLHGLLGTVGDVWGLW